MVMKKLLQIVKNVCIVYGIPGDDTTGFFDYEKEAYSQRKKWRMNRKVNKINIKRMALFIAMLIGL